MQSEQFQLHAQIEERHWWFVARRRILRELVRAISPANGQTSSVIVDIGCGTGANLAAFADNYRCVGIDSSAEAIELAQRRFPGIKFICGQAPSDVARWLKMASLVLLTDVLEHVADDRRLLAEIVDASGGGTHVLITVPADMRLWSPHDVAFGHYRRYDADGLESVWGGLPVEARLISHFNSRLYPAVRMKRWLNQRRGRTSGEANTDFELPNRPINSALRNIFAGESRKLLKSIDRREPAYRRGVSLVAILEKRATPQVQTMVDDLQPAIPMAAGAL
jgi:SAM-dependent methyltransferase